MQNYAYLVFVDADVNHNKYYEIIQNDDDSIDVRYGRVGASETHHHYSPYEKSFDSLKRSKEKKGYKDVTDLHAKVSVSPTSDGAAKELNYEPITDEAVKELVELLVNSSREFMKRNYTVSVEQITQEMVDKAEQDLLALEAIAGGKNTDSAKIKEFNEKLTELFTDVPRKLNAVSKYMANSVGEFQDILIRERSMLNNIRGMVVKTVTSATTDNGPAKAGTVLDAYGLTIRPVTFKEEDEILMHLGRDYNGTPVESRFVRAFRVINTKTNTAYDDFVKEYKVKPEQEKFFYHGSKVENWWSILKLGLLLNPNAAITGKMFGNGIYGASECRKSLNYMDVKGAHWNSGSRDSGYCAILKFAMGNMYEPTSYTHTVGSMTWDKLPKGCHSMYANKDKVNLRNDEYIVYKEEQVTIQYLMEIQAYGRKMNFNLERKRIRNRLKAASAPLIKVQNNFVADFSFENLPQETISEFSNLMSGDWGIFRVKYSKNTGKPSFVFVDKSDKETKIDSKLTADDKDFLFREVKKVYAESEEEWTKLVA